MGITKTLEGAKYSLFWPGMFKQIKEYVSECIYKTQHQKLPFTNFRNTCHECQYLKYLSQTMVVNFLNSDFKELAELGFEHRTLFPGYPKSKGLVEKGVGIAKI
jgi:hypothetical protein